MTTQKRNISMGKFWEIPEFHCSVNELFAVSDRMPKTTERNV